MVEVIGLKLVTHHPVIEPVSATEPGTEISDAETDAQRPDPAIAEISQDLGCGFALREAQQTTAFLDLKAAIFRGVHTILRHNCNWPII